jgi:hypothetical protein
MKLTNTQLHVLEWFATRDWTPHREWIREMTTATPRSLVRHGLLDVDHSRTTTHYRINDAGRAAIAPAKQSNPCMRCDGHGVDPENLGPCGVCYGV